MSDPAVEHLSALGLDYELVHYGKVHNAAEAAAARGIELRQLVKTLVVRRGEGDYVFVMISGDCAIDWKKLRAELGVRRLSLPDAATAKAATGYDRGTITPLGATHAWPVVADERVAACDLLSLGSGRHGRAVNLAAGPLLGALEASVADVAGPPEPVH